MHCACNTVQLLQRYRLPFSSTMPPNSPELNALITIFRESYSSVNMSRESERLKKSSRIARCIVVHRVSEKTFYVQLAMILTYTIRLWYFVFPPHLSSASALPCIIGNPENTALVHCACNTVQLLQRYRLPFSSTMPPNSSELNALITRFRELYSRVNMGRESKDRKNQAAGWIQAMH